MMGNRRYKGIKSFMQKYSDLFIETRIKKKKI